MAGWGGENTKDEGWGGEDTKDEGWGGEDTKDDGWGGRVLLMRVFGGTRVAEVKRRGPGSEAWEG